ncbi:MetQ/NlpA family ABC transporter substrate-binding protein [Eupransor demetentiae]|uniref:Periplasmic component/surface antigen (NlpA) n=1 Tax=Eupransor demetentiae TaxID=3109584 RepID=A0ABM9N5J7_9LACO|nr:ABC-type metal ion transport system [Lactobacillaceae bacterium LMG 33000]
MQRKTKIVWSIILLAIVIFGYFTFVSHRNSGKEITLGTVGSDQKIWQHIADSKAAKKAGIKLNVKVFSDSVSLNKATAEGTINVNAFQSYNYLAAYNKENPKGKVGVVGTTYLEPLGIYSDKYKSLDDLPEGGTIAIANDPADLSRGLQLLASAGLIKLDKNFNSLSGLNAITDNPHNFKFKEIDDHTGPRVVKDPAIDAVLINNTIAFEAHLNVLKDSLYHEKLDQSTKGSINVLASSEKSKNDKRYKELLKLYHSKDTQEFIKKEFGGTKVEVDKPVSYLQ